jgi:hypothetical protein
MPPVSSTSGGARDDGDNFVAQLRCATADLRRALAALAPGMQISVELIAGAFNALRRCSQTQHNAGFTKQLDQNPQLSQALNEYRSVLRQWLEALQRVQGWLLAERARIEGRRAHACAVHTWIKTNEETR